MPATTTHKMKAPVIEPDGTETVYDLTYTYSPGRPMVMYLINGDPGYPEEPAEVEITSCVPEVDDDRSLILYRYVEDHHEDACADAAAEADAMYEEYMELKREERDEKDVGAACNTPKDSSD